MDPPVTSLVNGGSYSTNGNAGSYNLSEIWQFPMSGAGMGNSGGMRRQYYGQFGDVSGAIRYVYGDRNPMTRKRRDVEDDESSPTKSSSKFGVGDCGGKRLKTAGKSGDENHEAAKGEVETSTEKPVQQPDPPKQDYIHVRARRGQATDSHSLAERARREKISERMKILQDLVPGCNKVIGKALVLDEIINYIQSLQRQVEFLSMKLEAVNTRMTPTIEVFPSKEYGQQTFDTAGMAFGSQPPKEYSRGSSPDWLHMQVGGGFDRSA